VELPTRQSRRGRDQSFLAAAGRRHQELAVQLVQAKPVPLEKEGRARMLSRARREAGLLQPSGAPDNHNAARKKAKRLRRLVRNNSDQLSQRLRKMKIPEPLFLHRLGKHL
jgi:hypothetical protein